ncbi:hypothetical protein IMY05_005G0194700 [Salix suchowensis]|nr:hypothetical protein IMY05_005G0194700 [Salix suchowensis]
MMMKSCVVCDWFGSDPCGYSGHRRNHTAVDFKLAILIVVALRSLDITTELMINKYIAIIMLKDSKVAEGQSFVVGP